MQTLESLKRQIRSTEDLGSVVSTMKSLSAVNIRHYERAARSVRRYYRTVELGLHVVLHTRGFEPPRRATRRAPGRPGATALLVFGSDYGLCGQFNDDLAEYALDRADDLEVDRGDLLVAAIGARAAVSLRGRGVAPREEHPTPSSVGGIEAAVRRLLLRIDAWNATGGLDRALLVYHQHRTASDLALRAEQLLPVELSRFRRLAEGPWPSRRLPTFTLDAERLLGALLRQYFSVALFRALAESAASEHASRLRAMQAAERSIEERLDGLRAEFQRRRQDAITAELLDIVSGYEALSGPGSR